MTQQVKKYYPDATVRRSAFTSGWSINAPSGIPQNRTRNGIAEFKLPNETLCHQVKFNYGELYASGGTYTPGTTVLFADERLAVCGK